MAYRKRRVVRPKRRLQRNYARIGSGGNVTAGTTRAPLRGGPRMRMAIRPVQSRSYTATVNKQKKMHQSAISVNNGSSFSYFNYGARYKPAIMKSLKTALAKQVKLKNGSFTSSSNVGQQKYQDVLGMFTITDLKDMVDDISATQLRKVCFLQCKARALFTNQDNGICRMIIYDLICRRDSTNDLYDSPQSSWYQGSLQLTGGASDLGLIPGATPYGVPGFTSNFKVLKTTHIQLVPGQMHEHRISFKPHKLFSSNILFTSEHENLKGLTVYTICVISGAPANDTVNNAQISLGKTKIDCVYTKEYKYCYLESSIPTYTGTNSLLTAFTTAEEYMSLAKGEKVTDAQA